MRIVTGPMTVSTRHPLPRNPPDLSKSFPARTLDADCEHKTASSSHSSDTGTDTGSASAQVTSVTKLNKNFPRRERENQLESNAPLSPKDGGKSGAGKRDA